MRMVAKHLPGMRAKLRPRERGSAPRKRAIGCAPQLPRKRIPGRCRKRAMAGDRCNSEHRDGGYHEHAASELSRAGAPSTHAASGPVHQGLP